RPRLTPLRLRCALCFADVPTTTERSACVETARPGPASRTAPPLWHRSDQPRYL
ncbi:hypothetical protein H4R34_006428, partial [Dimargaris verticillata]